MKSVIAKIAVINIMICSSVFAATTGTLTLSGTIASVVDIVVAPDSNASSLNLGVTQSNLQVAVVTENSNATNGYRIKAKSANNGQIKHASRSDNVAYTLKYNGGTAVALTTSDQIVKTQSTGGVYSSVANNVTISYTGANLTAGNYSDTVTFTIEAL